MTNSTSFAVKLCYSFQINQFTVLTVLGKICCTSGTYYKLKVNSTTHFITDSYDFTQSIGYFIIIKYGGVM